jgi:hypothetical protein
MNCENDLIIGREKVQEFEFKTAGALTDPSAIRYYTKAPGAADPTEWIYGTDPEIEKISTGRFRVRWLPDIAGLWLWRLESEGVVWADQGSFQVIPENV